MVLEKPPPTLDATHTQINHLHSYPTPRTPSLFLFYIQIINICTYNCAGPSGRAVYGEGVRPLAY